MVHAYSIAAENLDWVLVAASLLLSALANQALLVLRRGFGRRGFGRGLGSFRLIRILFVLLFTTVLGPIVLVVLLVAGAYWFYTSRRGR